MTPLPPLFPQRISVKQLAMLDTCSCQFLALTQHLLAHGSTDGFDAHVPPLFGRIAAKNHHWETAMLRRYYRSPHTRVIDLEGVAPNTYKDYIGQTYQQQPHLNNIPLPAQHCDNKPHNLFLKDSSPFHQPVTVYHAVQLQSYDNYYGTIPFLVNSGGRWHIQIPKIGSHVRHYTLAQLGLYALLANDILDDVPTTQISPEVHLSSGNVSAHDCDVVRDYGYAVIAEALEMIALVNDEYVDETWWQLRNPCGQCWHCHKAIEQHNDVMQISGVGTSTRESLHQRGVYTLDDLVKAPLSELPSFLDAELLRQAHAQYTQQQERIKRGCDSFVWTEKRHTAILRNEDLPSLQRGDVFLDMELDYLSEASHEDNTGLVYLIGVVGQDIPSPHTRSSTAPSKKIIRAQATWETAPIVNLKHSGDFSALLGMTYWPLWAHNAKEERSIFCQLITFLLKRRKKYPDMRVYHYSYQEKLSLKRASQRYGFYAEELQDLMHSKRGIGQTGIFTDLFKIVKHTIRTGQPGYSLKELEPLFCGQLRRAPGINDGADSLVLYDQLLEASALEQLRRQHGDESTTAASFADQLQMYNEYDCCSMVLLHEWLRMNALDYP
ncbi:MAG: ribonuclease H-like domain-containing protein [Actinomycetaceae bacterium]|nr:ribonuclease H-like domain-containing protein [Actinomycetaceae bacterium]